MDTRCPICSKIFSKTSLERHVNICLDSQETGATIEISTPSPNESRDDIIIDEETTKKRKGDAFLSLGLKMDSKKKKLDLGRKNRPSLTKLLIEEKRLRERMSDSQRSSSQDPISKVKQESVDTVEETELPRLTNETKNDPIRHADDTIRQPSSPVQASITSPTILSQPPRKSAILQRGEELAEMRREAGIPLAQRLRPKSLDDYFGQDKLLGKNGLLRNIIQADQIPSFILWGVPGVGKTTLARIIAQSSSCKFVELSGSQSNSKNLRDVFVQAENEKHLTGRKTILFLDEIHRFNKAVQDLLLPVIEKGLVTVIGATTENPSFTLNNALLSRMHTFVMEPLTHESLSKILSRGLFQVNKLRKNLYNLHYISLKRDAIDYIAELSTGDSRVALNLLESVNAYLSTDDFKLTLTGDSKPAQGVIHISAEKLKPLLSTRNFHQMYDRNGESHYDTISAFHKSVRGSDADAAMFYLTKMLSGGEDPLFIMRRMIVMASEDIGLRDSSCLPFAMSAKEALEFVGMPEGEIILAHCAVKLARAPKSTKSYRALRTAQALLKEHPEYTKLPIPMHIRNAPTKLMKELGYGDAYRYNPNFKHGVVHQTYLPKEMEGTKFVEETHLGIQEDELVAKEEYLKRSLEDKEYQEFKRKRREASRKEFEKQKTTQTFYQHPYDENLPKEVQPGYFDGDERDVYSDDPDCTNNFEHPYDEFLDRESQPEYFEGHDDEVNFDSDVPLENGIEESAKAGVSS